MIFWLASFPRSGNSFFRMVCKSVYGFQIHSIYPEKKAYADSDNLKKMVGSKELYMIKTHEMPSDKNPAIYLVRDGRDALVSLTWFNMTSRTNLNQEISKKMFHKALEKTIYSKSFGGWSENVLAWARHSSPVTLIKFEDLVRDPEHYIPQSLKDVGFDFNKQDKAVPTFTQLHNNNPHLFRKGKIGGWQEHMLSDLHDLFWEKHGEAMDVIGYLR